MLKIINVAGCGSVIIISGSGSNHIELFFVASANIRLKLIFRKNPYIQELFKVQTNWCIFHKLMIYPIFWGKLN